MEKWKIRKRSGTGFYNKWYVKCEAEVLIQKWNKNLHLHHVDRIHRRNVGDFINMESMINKMFEYKMAMLIEKGEVYIGNTRMWIERISAKKGIEHDKKWNGYDYIVKSGDDTYVLHQNMIESLYNKVKTNWLIYG